ncbi:hypothetical protein ACH40D_15635 [Streptomyces olivaceoviridis]|uniref:Uncharacterized protein n=1 Tax=Streptomyces olivaceoviridis TaxID=1921 RepID=A0ABW7VMA9_STROI|nr:hypothetical protein [Streptomyces corchorusii]
MHDGPTRGYASELVRARSLGASCYGELQVLHAARGSPEQLRGQVEENPGRCPHKARRPEKAAPLLPTDAPHPRQGEAAAIYRALGDRRRECAA